MNSSHSIVFLTHAQVNQDPEVPVTEWGLSDTGRARHEVFNQVLQTLDIADIHCSAEHKAIDGAAIAASHLGKHYQVHETLHENDRSSTGYLPPAEFELTADRFFAHPAKSIRGWEKAADAQQRIVTAVRSIDANSDGKGSLLIVAHGGVGALLLCHLQQQPISRELDQPGTGGGNYFRFERGTNTLIHGWKTI